MSKIRNQVLYEKYRDFVSSVCRLLSQELSKGKSMSETIKEKVTIKEFGWGISYISKPAFHWVIYDYEGEIERLPEFIACIEYMIEDPAVEKPQVTDKQGKIVDNPDYSPFLKTKLTGFLIEFVDKVKSFKFSDDCFKGFYKDYEDYLYADELVFRTFSFLQNFECDAKEIDLGEGVKIRRISDKELEQLYDEEVLLEKPSVFGSIDLIYVLEIVYTTKKSTHVVPTDIFDKVNTALRLFKGGVTGLDNWQYSMPVKWAPREERSSQGRVHIRRFIGNKYELIETEEFKRFWREFKTLDTAKLKPLPVALRRFNYVYERERLKDKLIDLMISFESLFLIGGEKQELGYRLSLRTAILLEKDMAKRNRIFSDMRDAYNIRSKVVHGTSKKGIDKIFLGKSISFDKFVAQIEEYLRECLNKFLLLCGQQTKHENIINDLDNNIFTTA